MPELPEVETVVRDLRPLLVERTIRGVTAGPRKLRHSWKTAWNAKLAGATVGAVTRRGKWIVVHLIPQPPSLRGKGGPDFPPPPLRGGDGGRVSSGPRLLLHLGMTGQLTVIPAADPRADHTHLVFELDNDHQLRFRDIRRFGSATLFAAPADLDAFLADRVGPEPFGLDPAYFRSAVRNSARSLKAILLDQTIVAGVGNIYADESCHRASLHPGRRGESLTVADADRLREAIEAVLTRAIAGRGSSIRDYIGGNGQRGGFQNEFAVYGRTGEACGRCETAIEMVRLGGRASHFCPRCQPMRRARAPLRVAAKRGQ
jgi:formamidopyrimidine-DNA glycosylase